MATAGDGRGPGPERAFCAPLPDVGEVTLSPEESRHLCRVRRVREGEAVVLFDGAGTSRIGRLGRSDARAAVVVLEGAYPDREPARPVVLGVSLPEAGRADDLVATLAELGVSRLLPLASARTPAGRLDLVERRRDRWTRLLREAAKVSGRSRLLVVERPATLAEVLADRASAPGGVLVLDPDPAVPTLVSRLPGEGPLPCLLVGPEGGFTAEEVVRAESAGANRVRLGATALRTATAAAAAAAIALCAR